METATAFLNQGAHMDRARRPHLHQPRPNHQPNTRPTAPTTTRREPEAPPPQPPQAPTPETPAGLEPAAYCQTRSHTGTASHPDAVATVGPQAGRRLRIARAVSLCRAHEMRRANLRDTAAASSCVAKAMSRANESRIRRAAGLTPPACASRMNGLKTIPCRRH